MKKHIFEIIWLATIIVVVGQIVFFVNKKKLPEGLIIIEESGEKNSVHLARSLNHRYLPSSAKSLNSQSPEPEQQNAETITIEEEEPAIEETEDQLDYRFTTLPGTQYRLRFTSAGEFEQVSSTEPAENIQVIEDLAIEVEPHKRLKSSEIEEGNQPLN